MATYLTPNQEVVGSNPTLFAIDYLGVTLAQCRASECDSERYQVKSDMSPLSDFKNYSVEPEHGARA